MTNGEMIQKAFNCEVCEPIPEDDIIHVIFPDKNDSAIGFDWSWWNMEYKEPTTKNDLGVDVPDNNVGNIDCISRAQAQTKIEMNASRYTIARERGGMGQVEWSDQLIKVSDAVNIIRELPSVMPKEPIHGKCNQCKYYGGVHDVQGHAPCSYHKIGGVLWNWYCSQFESEDKK